MKKLAYILITFLWLTMTSEAQNNVGISDDNSNPDSSAILDVYSTTKGMLIPRVALTSTTSSAPVTNPEASLLVYNTATAADVTPGYYYWDSISWVRLQTTVPGVQKFSTVTKTSSGTIVKTDNIIFASGDITLTLPAVTNADDGLEIYVKNVGNYMDIVTVTGANGTEYIDDSTSSILYREWGITYIAKSGNWVTRENLGRLDNIFVVSSKSSWQTIAQIVEFLGAHITGHSTVILSGETYTIATTQVIDLPYPVTFEGLSYSSTSIGPGTGIIGKPLFRCITECHFTMIKFDASTLSGYGSSEGEDALIFSGSDTTYHDIKGCTFDRFYNAIVDSSNAELGIFDCDISNSGNNGILLNSNIAGAKVNIEKVLFLDCIKGVNLSKGSNATVVINTGHFTNHNTTDTAIVYNPSTFSFSSLMITGNSFDLIGKGIENFDFTRADGRDANAFIENNTGIKDRKPICKINVINNASIVTCITANVWYKATWANTSFFTTNFVIEDNKITYQPKKTRDVYINISGNILVNAASRIITIGIVKNGVTTTRYGETKLRITTASQAFQFSTTIYLENVNQNDYFELYCSTVNSGDILTFQDIYWFVNSQ